MTPCDQLNVYPAMVVCGNGGVSVVNSGEPTVVLDVKSGRISRAKRTAPSMLISPVPCSNMFQPESGCAVYMSRALTRFGVKFGLACRSSAAAPAATGVAIDEPFIYIILRES